MSGILKLVSPPQQRLAHRGRKHHTAAARAKARSSGTPRSVQPLTSSRIANGSEVELAEQRHERIALTRPLSRHAPSASCVLVALRLVQPEALQVKIHADAKQHHARARRLLFARLRSEAKALERADVSLPMKLSAAQLHALAQHWRSARIEDQIIDTHMRAIINVLRHGEESGVRLRHLLCRSSCAQPGGAALRQPCQHARILRRVHCIDCLHGLTRVMNQEVGDAHAFGGVRSAAKAAAIVHQVRILSADAIARQLQ